MVLLSTTRACSRSVHVNMGCVISSYESINSSPSLVVSILLTTPSECPLRCDQCDQCAARAVAHAGPCAAHAARGWRGPAAGRRKGAAQPPGRLAWGTHAAAWGRMPFHTRKRVGAARPMRAHARPMRRAAGVGPLRANGKGHPSRPDATHGAHMPLHGWSSRRHRRIG